MDSQLTALSQELAVKAGVPPLLLDVVMLEPDEEQWLRYPALAGRSSLDLQVSFDGPKKRAASG